MDASRRSQCRTGQRPAVDRPPARVLVVDDEYGARLQVELALMTSPIVEIAGEASDGMRGAELAEQLQPDVVVLDLSMPVMDGFEALPLIRRLAPRSRILVRSNQDDPAQQQRALDAGADAFIPKFLDPEELRQAIETASRPRRIMTARVNSRT